MSAQKSKGLYKFICLIPRLVLSNKTIIVESVSSLFKQLIIQHLIVLISVCFLIVANFYNIMMH